RIYIYFCLFVSDYVNVPIKITVCSITRQNFTHIIVMLQIYFKTDIFFIFARIKERVCFLISQKYFAYLYSRGTSKHKKIRMLSSNNGAIFYKKMFFLFNRFHFDGTSLSGKHKK